MSFAVTGVRRCGKSKLLELYQGWLLEQGVEKEQIISINFEDLDYEELTDYKKLYEHLKGRLLENKMTYIFLDEIQNVDVNKGFLEINVDIAPYDTYEAAVSADNKYEYLEYHHYGENNTPGIEEITCGIVNGDRE